MPPIKIDMPVAPGNYSKIPEVKDAVEELIKQKGGLPAQEETSKAPPEEKKPTYCKYCGWREGMPLVDINDEEDKARFITAVSYGNPFTKEYSLCGGAVKITFRGLTPYEFYLCQVQLNNDLTNGNLVANKIDENVCTLFDYQMCLAITQIERADGSKYSYPESVEKWKLFLAENKHEVTENVLADIAKFVRQKGLPSLALHNAARLMCNHFQDLHKQFEVRAPDPDFWKAARQEV